MAAISKLISKVFIYIILAYRLLVRPFVGAACRFEPSCSFYALEAIKTHGNLRGIVFAMKRLLRCHPWHPGGIDAVPPISTESSFLCRCKGVMK